MENDRLGELLLATEATFLNWFSSDGKSEGYLRKVRQFTREFAVFCRDQVAAHPWELRQKYLTYRAMSRAQKPYSTEYLRIYKRWLGKFLRWYQGEAAAEKVCFGQLPVELVDAYCLVHQEISEYQKKRIKEHLPHLEKFLLEVGKEGQTMDVDRLLTDYFEQRRLARRGGGYSHAMTVLAEQLTRKHLTWLERQGYLPAGTARGAGEMPEPRTERGPLEVFTFFAKKVDGNLPEGLRRPLIEYLKHMVYDQELSAQSLYEKVRTNLTLCRFLAEDGADTFARMQVRQLDETVSSLVGGEIHDMLRRRRRVQKRHGELRGFLRYLQRNGLVERDLAGALISPPCYRETTPPRVLSEDQVSKLMESLDRSCAKGRRSHAILMLITTYGLRPVDISGLRLDDLHWRNEMITFVQKKTGVSLTLPLIAEVARSLYEYLRKDRDLQTTHRHVFLSLYWPHEPLKPPGVAYLVKEALRQAGLFEVSARNLRSSVATHLLRQGESLSSIQEILGHRSAETTQRYAVVDPPMLSQVLDEDER